MTRLLAYEPAWRRILPRLGPMAERLCPVLVGEDARLRCDGAALSEGEAQADIAWMSGDLFEGPAARPFMVAALKSPGLTWMQSAAAGFDDEIFRRIIDKGARLTTSHGQAVGMAEWVLWGVLDHFQRGPERRAAQAGGEWRRFFYREVSGTTWLVFGFGAVGRGVAARARALGARILAVRRQLGPDPLADEVLGAEAVIGRLSEADVVVMAAPLSAVTRHVANGRFFAAMKPASVFVNLARGALVDEAALIAALNRDAPGFALLDVFETEPLPDASPLWSHPKVSITAHASGITAGQRTRNDALFVDNLTRFLEGAPLLHEADPADVRAAPGGEGLGGDI
ncbi:MAG TPA: NAD(P)-dependent oxidoreductase [Caulobacteraceae bacterium]|nr:NAD(P)-dependent oxidoreductase [Caulobacteraceae bacterium]